MKNILFIISILTLLFTSCQKDDAELNINQLIIEMGSICGWCAAGDTLVMTKSNTKFQLVFPCDGSTVDVNEITNSADWAKQQHTVRNRYRENLQDPSQMPVLLPIQNHD